MHARIFLSRSNGSRHLFEISVSITASDADVFTNGTLDYQSEPIHGEAAVQRQLLDLTRLIQNLGHSTEVVNNIESLAA